MATVLSEKIALDRYTTREDEKDESEHLEKAPVEVIGGLDESNVRTQPPPNPECTDKL